MSTALLPSAAAEPAVFPPPSVLSSLLDGDRYEWSDGDAWTRVNGGWRPMPEEGSGWLAGAHVRQTLSRAVARYAGLPSAVECLHVFVLSETEA